MAHPRLEVDIGHLYLRQLDHGGAAIGVAADRHPGPADAAVGSGHGVAKDVDGFAFRGAEDQVTTRAEEAALAGRGAELCLRDGAAFLRGVDRDGPEVVEDPRILPVLKALSALKSSGSIS